MYKGHEEIIHIHLHTQIYEWQKQLHSLICNKRMAYF